MKIDIRESGLRMVKHVISLEPKLSCSQLFTCRPYQIVDLRIIRHISVNFISKVAGHAKPDDAYLFSVYLLDSMSAEFDVVKIGLECVFQNL